MFERDNWICQNKKCEFCNNEKGTFLNAHHIKSFCKYEDCRFNVDNGITYCSDYHRKLHGEIGYKGE